MVRKNILTAGFAVCCMFCSAQTFFRSDDSSFRSVVKQYGHLTRGLGHFLAKLQQATDPAIKRVYVKNILHLFDISAYVNELDTCGDIQRKYNLQEYLNKVVCNNNRRFNISICFLGIGQIKIKNVTPVFEKGAIVKYRCDYEFMQLSVADTCVYDSSQSKTYTHADSSACCYLALNKGVCFIERNDDYTVGEIWSVKLGDIYVKHANF